MIDNMLLDTAGTGMIGKGFSKHGIERMQSSKVIISISPSLVARKRVITTVDMVKTNLCHMYA